MRHTHPIPGMLLLILVTTGTLASQPGHVHANEPRRLDRPFPTTLPEVVALVDAEDIGAQTFRAAVERRVVANPGMFGLPDTFFHDVMIRKEQARLGIPDPTPQAIAARLARYEREQATHALGGGEPSFQRIRDTFEAMLENSGLTRGDMARAVELELLLEAVVQKTAPGTHRRGNVTIDPAALQAALEAMHKRYDPVYRGMDARVVASVGGRNFERDDIVDFCLLRGQDRLLRGILSDTVDEMLLVEEARRAGIPADTGMEALQGLLGELLTPTALRQYYESRRDDFAVIRARHIFLAFAPPAKPGASGSRPMRRGEADVRRQAQELLRELRTNPTPEAFAKAAEEHSDCLSRRQGGILGYVPASSFIPHRIAPEVYLLDRIRTGRGLVSPIIPAPEEGMQRALLALEDGALSQPVKLEAGYSILMRESTRHPQNPERILDLLGQMRFAAERDALLSYLREERSIALRWRPETRNPGEAVLYPTREMVMDRTADLRASVARIELPELGD